MDNSNKRYSHDSACDSTGDESNTSYFKARDDASIYSTNSTTSSMFSTSSRMSKIPNAVKSSVKYLVRRNKNRSNETSTTDHETFSSKLKRTTINFSLFSRNKPQEIIPTSTASSTLFQQQSKDSEIIKAKRRNSVVNLASRFLVNNNNDKKKDENVVVGSLLFGKQVDDLEFMVHEEQPTTESDSKSEKLSRKPKKEEPWTRQRAKSCQENKTPMLRQLATKNSSCNLPESDSIPYKSTTIIKSDLPLFKGLVTTTLTTLHTRLINECDRALSLILLANSNNSTEPQQTTDRNIPQEQLLSIISDLHKMTEMVNWEQQTEKDDIKSNLQQLEKTVLNQHLTIAIVKDIVSNIKQTMNQCICQYYKIVEKAIVIPSKGYKIEGINKYGSENSALMIRDETIDYSKSTIDHKDLQAHWYKTFFNQDDIHTFFGYYKNGDPVLISIQVEEEQQQQQVQESEKRQYRIIHRTKDAIDRRKIIQDSFLLNAPTNTTTTTTTSTFDKSSAIIQNTTWKTIIETTVPDISFQDLVKMNKDQLVSSGIHEELVRLDEASLHTRYKFGVLLIKQGQTKEEDWFSNQHTKELDDFLNIIGRKVELRGYSGWAAGLDTKSKVSCVKIHLFIPNNSLSI